MLDYLGRPIYQYWEIANYLITIGAKFYFEDKYGKEFIFAAVAYG